MIKQVRAMGAAATVGLAVLGLSGCSGIGTSYTVSDEAKVDQQISAIRLDSDSGGVTVNGSPGTTGATVQRSIDSPNQQAPGPTYRVENGTLVLSGCGQYCSVNYTLTVPAGLPITGSTTSGAVELNNVGSVDVTTNSGGVTLNDVAGPTKVQTTNGGVRGSGIKGDDLQAKTGNGAIDLTLATAQNIRGETSNGKITLTVPSGAYQVTTTTNNGEQQVDVPNDPSGTHRLDLTTSNGDITVRRG